ncbi:MAG: aspartate kinase [Spirochaetes bacterium]|nr:aspartate kinase [Spirochaetota bacterium]
MKVVKFGGTSLANAAQIEKIYDIVTSDSERKIVVVSAPGKRDKHDTKVTDLLIAAANKYLQTKNAAKEIEAVIARYREIAVAFKLGEDVMNSISGDFLTRLESDTTNPEKYMDRMKAGGEDNAAKITAAYFASRGKEARYVNPKDAGLLVSEEFGNAQVLDRSYDALKALKSMKGIVIFPGFFGYSPSGDVVTFPRGGSDITGSILAKAVQADVYENFTDVDSVFAASPALVEKPAAIDEMTYREMRELSYAGFSVFHEEALFPAFQAGVPVNVRNTNNPSAPGTHIVMTRKSTKNPIVGIACDNGFSCVYLSKYLMNREIGFGRRLLKILEEEKIPFEHMPSGVDDISVIVRNKYFDAAIEKRVTEKIRTELKVDRITIERGLSIIMIVGEGMRHTVGLTARVAGAFASVGVNIEIINQGSSEVSIMFGVKEKDSAKAVASIYKEFFTK